MMERFDMESTGKPSGSMVLRSCSTGKVYGEFTSTWSAIPMIAEDFHPDTLITFGWKDGVDSFVPARLSDWLFTSAAHRGVTKANREAEIAVLRRRWAQKAQAEEKASA